MGWDHGLGNQWLDWQIMTDWVQSKRVTVLDLEEKKVWLNVGFGGVSLNMDYMSRGVWSHVVHVFLFFFNQEISHGPKNPETFVWHISD